MIKKILVDYVSYATSYGDIYIYIIYINIIPIGWLLSGDIVTGAIMVV
jgi:hypothetical protein